MRRPHDARDRMTVAAPPSRRWLPLRFALRELRGGLRGFYVFIACIALGVMAIAGVGSVAASLADGLAREGRVILGGDLVVHADPARGERRRSARSSTAQGRVSARRDDARDGAHRATAARALVEIKAVDGAYPLYRRGRARSGAAARRRARRSATASFGAAADPALLARLDLKPGARITVGAATIEIRAALASEPDKLAGGIGFGPRLLISEEALRATGLLQPGSLVRWHYRLRLPDNDASDAAVARVIAAAAKRACRRPAGRSAPAPMPRPSLEQNVERFTQYLTLVGLTALLVGGVGVANAVKGHLDRKRDVIATMKSLGATGGGVFAIYLTQALALAVHRRAARPRDRRRAAVPDRVGFRRDHSAAARAGAASGRPRARARSTACSPRSPSRCGRSGARTTCRSRRCSATRSRPSARWPRRRYVVATVLVVVRAGGARGQARLRPAHRRDLRGRRPPPCS